MSHTLEFERLVRYDPGESGITVNIELRLGEDSQTFKAKIDTGSTYCIFNRSYGEKLGIEIENGLPETISTATGLFKAFGHQITLLFEDYELDATVYFAEDENFDRRVLGRHGFLDRLIIGINDYDGKIYLSRYESE